MRTVAVSCLKSRGYAVLEASCADQALAMAKAYDGDIGLVLSDVVMPGMDAKDMLGGLAAVRPAIRVLFMSGYPRSSIVHDGILGSGIELLSKPFTQEELLRRVRELLFPEGEEGESGASSG